MRCHYEVLGLNLNANDEEIKKSYRKNALLWHPDKNPDSKEEAHRQFLLVQQAYDVLSDPQERSWYDKHRDAILRGGLGKGDQYEDKSLNLFQYFNASCYTGYHDDPNGFYQVYEKVFKLISEEDIEFIEQGPNMELAPEFGNSTSSYEEVVGPFYSYWDSYSTAKSYVWVDKYDIRQAPNRQVRRAMEQENKKLRDKAKKNRNEEVKALVAFVKKRDKRVKTYNQKLKDRALEIKKLAEEKRERDRKKRIEEMKNYKETSWSASSERAIKQLERLVDHQFGDGDEDEYDDDGVSGDDVDDDGEKKKEVDDDDDMGLDYNELDELYCPVCNKEFKSISTHENHKKSKKHLITLEHLVQKMKHLDEVITKTENDDGSGDDKNDPLANVEGEDDRDGGVDDAKYNQDHTSQTKGLSKKQKKKMKMQQKRLTSFIEEDSGDDNEEVEHTKDNISHESTNPGGDDADHIATNISSSLNIENDDVTNNNTTEQHSATNDNADHNTIQPSTKLNEELFFNETTTNEILQDSSNSSILPQPEDAILNNQNIETDEVNIKKNKKQTLLTTTKTTSNIKEQFVCNVCKAAFQTRNKLFEHIKVKGHALRIGNSNVAVTSQQPTSNVKKTKNKKSKS